MGTAGKYRIEFTPEATEDLRWLRKYDQKMLVDRVEAQLLTQPTLETRHRKPLRPNDPARWELRVGRFRVFYDVSGAHNKLLIRGREYQL